MLRYKTETRPGLVALYDIRPGNGVGLFLQPCSPHGAALNEKFITKTAKAITFISSHKCSGRYFTLNHNLKWIKHPEETQPLRAGCSKAEPKFLAPPQTPFPGARDGQNLISWDGHYLYLQTQFGEDRCMQFRVIVVTPTNTPTRPQTGPITIQCAAASVQCKYGLTV